MENDGGKDLPAELDPVISAVLSNDLEARRALIHFTTAGCTNAQGLGGPPKCEPGQTEGTPVQYLPILGPGEGVTVLPEDLDRSLDFQAETLCQSLSGIGALIANRRDWCASRLGVYDGYSFICIQQRSQP